MRTIDQFEVGRTESQDVEDELIWGSRLSISGCLLMLVK